jgi:sec-independent protein translocase protein TatA
MILNDYDIALSAFSMPGGWEWIIALVVVLIIFGPKRLPQLSRAVGKSIRDFKKGLNDVREEIDNADVDDDEDEISSGEAKKEKSQESGQKPEKKQA